MDKTCDRFFYRFVLFTPQYAPHVKDSQFFERIKERITSAANWNEKIFVEKSVFEQMLSNDEELEMAYVDVYSWTAYFILVFFEIDEINYEFYCMIEKKEIILFFFRKGI